MSPHKESSEPLLALVNRNMPSKVSKPSQLGSGKSVNLNPWKRALVKIRKSNDGNSEIRSGEETKKLEQGKTVTLPTKTKDIKPTHVSEFKVPASTASSPNLASREPQAEIRRTKSTKKLNTEKGILNKSHSGSKRGVPSQPFKSQIPAKKEKSKEAVKVQKETKEVPGFVANLRKIGVDSAETRLEDPKSSAVELQPNESKMDASRPSFRKGVASEASGNITQNPDHEFENASPFQDIERLPFYKRMVARFSATSPVVGTSHNSFQECASAKRG